MKVLLLTFGKNKNKEINILIKQYEKLINRYISYSLKYIQEPNNHNKLPIDKQKSNEAFLFLKEIQSGDIVIILDEKGKLYNSVDFSDFINTNFCSGSKRIVFIIGGPWGFHNSINKRVNFKISLSKLTFNHELANLVFCEQLYRAITIINNHPYHNE